MFEYETNNSAAVVELAEKIIDDIRLRRMVPGDRYLKNEEALRVFGAGKGVMNRALRLLSDHDILVRRQRMGTFIGSNAPIDDAVRTYNYYVLLFEESRSMSNFPFESMLKGLRRKGTSVNVQFNFVSARGGMQYVRELVAAAQAANRFDGVVPIGCPSEVNRYLVEVGVPLVAFGSFYGGGQSSPWIDLDRHSAGKLMTEYVVNRGHRRISLLNVTTGQPCENNLYDGVSEVLTAAGMPHNSLIHRSIPHSLNVIPEVVDELLQMPDHPTAFIVTSERIATAIATSVADLGLAVPNDVEIVFWDPRHLAGQAVSLPARAAANVFRGHCRVDR